MFELEPVAYVRGSRTEVLDDHWGGVESRIELDEAFGPECLDGIEKFSHVEVVYLFHRADPERVERGSRHPRGNEAWPCVGIFAQRAKDRPNQLGVTIATLVSREPRALVVRGLDAIEGTPVLDIKPVMLEFLPRGPVRQPAWSRELMKSYW
ncbi:MAG: SAM-dependent methyltransferase [Bryobacteraceae bacterium]